MDDDMTHGDNTIEVHVTNMPSPVESRNVGRSTWTTWVLGGSERRFQLLPQDEKRVVAQILVQGASATVPIFIGKRDQVDNKSGGQFFPAVNPSAIPYSGSTEAWLNPNGVACVVTVIDERGI